MVHEYTKTDQEFQNTAVRREELPFDSDRKLMSVTSYNHLYTKGAPDVILKKCHTILINGRKEILSQNHISAIQQMNQKYAEDGLRVLGFAYKDFKQDHVSFEDEDELTFIGLVSLMESTTRRKC